MSALATRPPRAPAPAAPIGTHAPAAPDSPPPARDSLAVRLAVFAALAAFGAGHWAALVADPPVGRMMLDVMAVSAGAAALALIGRSRLAAAARAGLGVLVALATAAAALIAVGLPARLLLPGQRGELADGLDRGLGGLRAVSFPYDGTDHWIRLVLLLGAPLLLALAATLAFWPVRRGTAVLRGLGLVVLLTLYGVAVTEHGPGAPLLRGLVLLILVAAWLWLPRLTLREAAPGAALVLAVGIAALPVAASLDADHPWWNWRNWNWFGGGRTVAFDWDHTYGPLDWPRDGTTLLNVGSRRPHYWKAETLDRFDGVRWLRSQENTGTNSLSELPQRQGRRGRPWRYGELNPRWDQSFRVTVRALRSDVVIGAGTTYYVAGAGATLGSSDGTTTRVEKPLRRGDSYVVRAYVPDPSARQMREAPRTYDGSLTEYTSIFLPPRGHGHGGQAAGSYGAAAKPAVMPLLGAPLSGSPGAARRLEASAYGRVFRLARRITARAPTAYDAVKGVESYLQRHYRYGERPPRHRLALPAFLFEDRYGYCQQFSGAMALMLRMVGIPSRVATGFSPGSYNRDTGEYRVRDLDAHSWVEAYFQGIGWVTFDPTPSAAPAESQLGGLDAASAAGAADVRIRDRSSSASAQHAPGVSGVRDGGKATVGLWAIPAGLALLALLGAAGLVIRRRLARRALSGGEPGDAQLRELRAALLRLGWSVPPATTLLELERRLHRAAGPTAAHYAARLRAHRYEPSAPRGPGRAARRALRRELAAGGGLRGGLRALLALPPARPRRPGKAL